MAALLDRCLRRPGWSSRISLGAVTLASLLVTAVGCGGDPAPDPIRVGDRPLVRLIAEEPQRLFDPSDLARLKSAQRSSWKLTLGHEVRNGLLAPPGSSVTYRLDVAGDCELRVGYGVPAGDRHPVVFRATATDAEGFESLLFEHRVEAGDDFDGQWREAAVSLRPWRGRELMVTLETSAAREFDLSLGIPLWANPHVVMAGGGEYDGLNLLVISIDTLRADRMSLYGYPLETTPFIDAWARDNGVVFSTVVAPSPWTLPSHVSLFTGLDAMRHGINHDVGGIRAEAGAVRVTSLDMMAEKLAREGFETAAFTGGAYVHPQYGFAQGFDRFAYWPDRRKDALELEIGIDRTLEWMTERSGSPFFAFLHTYAVHDPYRVRQPYFDRVAPADLERPKGRVALFSPKNDPATGFQQQNRFVFRPQGGESRDLDMTDEDRRMVGAMYDSGVAYADAQIGRLLHEMTRRGLSDRTIVVLTSDHGESLGERGQAGHIFLTDDNLLVPLVIAVPGGLGVGRVVHDQVRLIDILPTLYDLLDLRPAPGLDGVSLVPLMSDGSSPVPPIAWSYSAAANRGLAMRVDGKLKYIINNTAWAPIAGEQQLFDLTGDPAEIHDLASEDPRSEELRASTMSEFQQRAIGLRLRVQSGDGHLVGTIRGPAIRPVGTKAIHLMTAAVRSSGIGEASLDAPPGSSFALHFEKVFGWKLTVDGSVNRAADEIGFRHTFDVRDEGEVESLVLEGTRWNVVSRQLRDEEIGFSVCWHGGASLGGPSAANADSELAEQLRALGYVE